MMLLKKNPIYYLNLSFLSILMTLLVACGSDNSPTTDDTTNNDDEPDPSGFLGELVWVKTFGGSNVDQAVGVAESDDGGYVVLGSTNSADGDVDDRTSTDDYDYWVLKLNTDGEKQWSRSYGGTQDETATNIQKTSDGGYIISGYSRSNDGDVSGNEGFHDYWLLKIDSGGNKLWDKNYGFNGSDKCFSVIQTKDGGFFATGFLDVNESGGQGNDNRAHSLGDYWGIKMDANGDRVWRRYFGGSHVDESKDVLQTSDDGYLLIGYSESSDFDITDARGANDMWIVKVSPFGDLVWQKSFGGSEIDFGYGITSTPDGHFIIVGDTRSSDQDVSTAYGNADIWAVKFNGNHGGMIWEKSYGGGQFESARGITRLSDGSYLITGNTRSTNGDVSENKGLNDGWAIIINDDGDVLVEKTIGGTNLDFAIRSIETSNNELIIVGNSESSDNDIPLNKGQKDFMIVKMK